MRRHRRRDGRVVSLPYGLGYARTFAPIPKGGATVTCIHGITKENCSYCKGPILIKRDDPRPDDFRYSGEGSDFTPVNSVVVEGVPKATPVRP